MTGRTLSKNPRFRDRIFSSDLVQMSLLGAVRGKKEDDAPDLLYAMTMAQPKARICNIAQVGRRKV